MSTERPTLGYRSVTAAVRALLEEGLDHREIAKRIGCPVKNISAIKISSERSQARSGGDPGYQAVKFDRRTIARGRPAAARRGISVNELCRQIIEAVFEEGLIDAVLDDDAATSPRPDTHRAGANQ